MQNERLERELRSEKDKCRLLQEELDSFRKLSGRLTSSGGTPPGSGAAGHPNAAFGGMDELSYFRQQHENLTNRVVTLEKENRRLAEQASAKPEQTATDATLNALEMQERNAELLVALRHAEEQISVLHGNVTQLQNKPAKVEVVNVERPLVRTVTVENTEHVDQLRAQLNEMRDENMQLRHSLLSAQTQAPQVEVVHVDRYVIKPEVEVQVVEIESEASSQKIGALIEEQRKLTAEKLQAEAALADARLQLQRLQLEPARVDVQVVEVDSGERLRELVELLQQKETELGDLKRHLHEQGAGGKEVIYVDRDRIVEVPRVELQHVEVENSDVIEQYQRALELKDKELESTRAELLRAREAQRTTEVQLQDALKSEVAGMVLRRSAAVHASGGGGPPAEAAPAAAAARPVSPAGGAAPRGTNWIAMAYGVGR